MSIDAERGQRRYVAFAVNELVRRKGEDVTMSDIRATVQDAVIEHGASCMAAAGASYRGEKPIPEDVECSALSRVQLDELIAQTVDSWPDALLH